ncbi:MAG: heme ABC exporter ATP-binding protein CcmA [Anaerolineae bacterium]|nr:heme ABC exporter ATP-binding protein CcmA [Anaerolineae bacterium]
MPTPQPTPQPPADALIQVEGLFKAFGLRMALRGVSLSVARGSVLALLGPNGSGKTTLLRILSALSSPTRGAVKIGGWELPKEAAAVRARLGVVAHLPLLYDELSAEENLAFYARLYNCESNGRLPAVLEQVGLAKRARDPVRTFSRGMVQRLAIARAMLHDPPVLLLDEPYTGLDANGSAMLDGLLRTWRDEGRTVVVSIHDIAHAAEVCDRAVILRLGQVAADAALSDVPDLPALFARLTDGAA